MGRRDAMTKNFSSISILLSVFILFFSSPAHAQPVNLLENPYADDYTDYWRSSDGATIESCDGNPCFVVRYGSRFTQDIELYDDDAGKYALLTGLVSSERTNADGSITGLPYLYGYMMDEKNTQDISGRDIHLYLSVPSWNYNIPARPENEWLPIWRIYPVKNNIKKIRFFLDQAERLGVPHNGSAARFDDLGVYLFNSELQAQAFVDELYSTGDYLQ